MVTMEVTKCFKNGTGGYKDRTLKVTKTEHWRLQRWYTGGYNSVQTRYKLGTNSVQRVQTRYKLGTNSVQTRYKRGTRVQRKSQ